MRWSRGWALGVGATLALAPYAARAEVERAGTWPESEATVSLDLEGVPRGEALGRLAKAAGWSLVVHGPKADRVSLHIVAQPPGKVLDLLLDDGSYEATRDGSLISISPVDHAFRPPAAPPPPAAPAPPPAPSAPRVSPDDEADGDGLDRNVTGGSLRIEKGEVVHDVSVTGGNLDVWGTVTGDIAVMGGDVRVHRGARVRGDVAAVGGTLTLETEASIDGDVRTLGGEIVREPGARIGGEVREGVTKVKAHRALRGGKGKVEASTASAKARGRGLARGLADALNAVALLFLVGSVLVALAPDRMDRLAGAIAARPMRSFATGVVSIFAGALLLAALCVTVVGIPVALVLALVGVLGAIAGLCSVLETVGAALVGHRTQNPYMHLGLGALLFVVVTAVPHLGGLAALVVILTGIGGVVSTRAAGMMAGKLGSGSPYRDAPVT